MTKFFRIILGAFFINTLLVVVPAWAQSTLDVEKKREETLKEIGSSSIPDQVKLREIAKVTFAKPLADQKEDDLRSIADQSNRYANLVSYIEKEYESYQRENYRYEFIIKALKSSHGSYADVGNEFKRYRNQAYFNLGLKAKASGKNIVALLLFRDAFRLSPFDCYKVAAKDCMRWKAEQEMKKILGLENIESYVTWEGR